MRQKLANARVDVFIARIAALQHGVITTAQLVHIGLDHAGVTRRVAAGRLHRVHRGVYAVGHAALNSEGRWMAAVLACGEGAVLSHESAAVLWRLLRHRRGPVHVTVPDCGGRARREGITIHRSVTLATSHTAVRNQIPVTSTARTLSDLKRTVAIEDYRQALREAAYLNLHTGDERPDRTRSELERSFLALCRRHQLPAPQVNARVGRHVVDFLWADERLIVETDGWLAHRGRTAFREDRARDVDLKLLGYEVLRFTYEQVMREAASVARAIRSLLNRAAA